MSPDRRQTVITEGLHSKTGLVLPGGGARGAYQVGVLKAIAELLPRRTPNPFPVLSGTSAGAISAAVLASRARSFRTGVSDLERVWANFHSGQVYRCDSWTMLKGSLHWLAALVFGGLGAGNPRSLLDNAPLWALLRGRINFDAVQQAIDKGYLDALAITAAGYGSARSVTFYQADSRAAPWSRVRRKGRATQIALEHLMASIAVPLVFPPVRIGREYFGDGAMRQATPLSPALRLGAERLLVIGVRNETPDPLPQIDDDVPYPSFGRIAGYILDALFMDGLSSDLENLSRINLILETMPGRTMQGEFGALRHTDALIMLPSRDIRAIAARHVREMPRSIRVLLRGLGALHKGGSQLLSYLLFESGYTRELIALGYEDALARQVELLDFLSGKPVAHPSGIIGWRDLSEEYSQRVQVLKVADAALS
ncbi:MAG: patatin-like phospholipase family protein [Gammaproteobacteria bacterium]|nr:patatin-like phospholipase family protein [Gammaproteobacteria bacterium]